MSEQKEIVCASTYGMKRKKETTSHSTRTRETKRERARTQS